MLRAKSVNNKLKEKLHPHSCLNKSRCLIISVYLGQHECLEANIIYFLVLCLSTYSLSYKPREEEKIMEVIGERLQSLKLPRQVRAYERGRNH